MSLAVCSNSEVGKSPVLTQAVVSNTQVVESPIKQMVCSIDNGTKLLDAVTIVWLIFILGKNLFGNIIRTYKTYGHR